MLTAKQDNRLSAAETLVAALRQDPQPYATDKALQAILSQLDQLIAGLQPLRAEAQRQGKGGGEAETKIQARQHLALVAAEIAGDVFAYATDQKLPTLQAIADYDQSELERLRGSRLTDVATTLANTVADPAYRAPLQADYDLSEERLQELRDALKTFEDLKNEPRLTTTAGKAARQSLRTEFSTLGTLLKDRLLRVLRKYKRRAPDFYNRIIAARQVVNRPGSAAGAGAAPTPPAA